MTNSRCYAAGKDSIPAVVAAGLMSSGEDGGAAAEAEVFAVPSESSVESMDYPAVDALASSEDALETGEEILVTEGRPGGPIGVKWQVWLPVLLGLVSAFLSKLTFIQIVMPLVGLSDDWWVSNGVLLFSGDIYTFSLFILAFKLYKDWGSRGKFLFAVGVTVSLCLLGVVVLSVICWGFIIFGWLIVTVVWGHYRLSPLRTGIWLGFGGSVAIVLGNLLAHVIIQ